VVEYWDIKNISDTGLRWVTDLLMEFGKEYAAPCGANPEDIERLLNAVKKSGIGYAAFNDDGDCVGAIGGIRHRNLFNSSLEMLGEVYFYVAKDHRGSSVGGRLLNMYLEEAERLKLNVTMVALTTTPPGLERLLLRKGFEKREINYVLWAPCD